jgi:hypothetical protein
MRRPFQYAYLQARAWAPRLVIHWHPVYEGFAWFNISAPWIALYVGPRWHLSIMLWEWFNKECVDAHYWGFVLLNINGRALLSITHDGARGLWAK